MVLPNTIESLKEMTFEKLPRYCSERPYCEDSPRCKYKALCSRFVNKHKITPVEFYKRNDKQN